MPSIVNERQVPPPPAVAPAPVLRSRTAAITPRTAPAGPSRRHVNGPRRRPHEADLPHPTFLRDLPPSNPGPPRRDDPTRHILVVDHDPTFTKLLTSLLDASDDFVYDTRVAHTVKSALQRLAHEHFDVIIADLGLPDNKPYATFEALHQAAPQIPIVVITGTAGRGIGSSLEAVRNGASYFLRKGSVDTAAVERGIHYATERRNLSEILERDRDPDHA